MMRLNFLARKHPVNRLRVDVLAERLYMEYRPATTVLRSMCAQLAGTLEQLEVLKPGSTDWARLVQTQQLLSDALEQSRSAKTHTSLDHTTLSDDALTARFEQVLARAKARLALKPADATIVESTPIREEVTHAPTESEPAPAPTPPAPRPTLGEEHWESVGIHRINGVPSHNRLGDAHAAKILDGTIPLKDAIEDERQEQIALANMMLSQRWPNLL